MASSILWGYHPAGNFSLLLEMGYHYVLLCSPGRPSTYGNPPAQPLEWRDHRHVLPIFSLRLLMLFNTYLVSQEVTGKKRLRWKLMNHLLSFPFYIFLYIYSSAFQRQRAMQWDVSNISSEGMHGPQHTAYWEPHRHGWNLHQLAGPVSRAFTECAMCASLLLWRVQKGHMALPLAA